VSTVYQCMAKITLNQQHCQDHALLWLTKSVLAKLMVSVESSAFDFMKLNQLPQAIDCCNPCHQHDGDASWPLQVNLQAYMQAVRYFQSCHRGWSTRQDSEDKTQQMFHETEA